ncbi:MAG TPA: undecaprenyl-diphosphate phosphatase [Candidatus Paceibacterota bacterium]|nr:undecaprenyl-diphosphate phosphatase [Candidatus Paceibacterota bacterium]
MELTIFHSIFLGLIEGLTEFIPVSSTAHLLITRALFGISHTAATDAFVIAIQSGAIIAALWYFWSAFKKDKSIFFKVCVAFIPTALIGLLLNNQIHTLFGSIRTMSLALIIGGILLLLLPSKKEETSEEPISWNMAILLGLFQIAAFIPGMSRSGSLLIGGVLLGLPRKQITAFSFLLALPTIFGATVVDVWNTKEFFTPSLILLTGIGALAACIVALLTMRFFLRFIEKPYALKTFGWYRIALGMLVLAVTFFK